LVGRGIAYAERSGALVAIVVEVEIDRQTGKVWARKFTVAHDCGLIINPRGLRRGIGVRADSPSTSRMSGSVGWR
jgi:nicotinate dehydrogenase subunit B